MTKPRIIVTGATGKTGSVVVAELLKTDYRVRAMVRREDGRSARLKAQGAEIVVADMSDVERVADALKDVQRAYFCPPYRDMDTRLKEMEQAEVDLSVLNLNPPGVQIYDDTKKAVSLVQDMNDRLPEIVQSRSGRDRFDNSRVGAQG